MQWKSIKFWLWLEVTMPNADGSGAEDPGPQGPQDVCAEDAGTNVCFDISMFQSEFELNAIPSAVVSVAIGRRADDVTKAAEIHQHVDDLKLQLPATVWCLAKTMYGSDLDSLDEWPIEKFPIFIGNLTGSGFRRTNTGADMTLSLTHWLSNLNFSSATSKMSHPLNPAQLFYTGNMHLNLDLTGGSFPAGISPTMTSAPLAMPFFDTPTILTDFWGGSGLLDGDGDRVWSGLKDWLTFLTKQDRMNKAQILFVSIDDKPAVNREACRALRRFEPNNDGVYTLGVPLALESNPDLNTFIANAIGEEIGQEGFDSSNNVTLWDKLAGQFHSNYMFSVVPLVEKALVVPFVPGLSSGNDYSLVHRVIKSHQYDSLDINAQLVRPLRAVGILMHMRSEAGLGQNLGASAPYSSFGGYYDKWAYSCAYPGGGPADCDKRFKEGLIMYKYGPKWLSNFVRPAMYSAKSTGVTATSLATSLDPAAGESAPFDLPDLILENAQPIWDQYARTVYIHEILKNRQGALTGPVRFDIAPGSQIMIEVAEDKYVRRLLTEELVPGCEIDEFVWYWASVLRVSTIIDCQNNRAFTSYHIAHIRTEDENMDPSTSIPNHPIWKENKWAGCAMIEDDAFAPLTTRVLAP